MSLLQYKRLKSSDDEEVAAKEPLNAHNHGRNWKDETFRPWSDTQNRPRGQARLVHWVLHIVSAVTILMLATQLKQNAILVKQHSLEEYNLYSPLLDAVDRKMSRKKFMGSFRGESPYKGPPSPEVDAAWSRIVDFEFVNVSRDAMIKMGRPLDSVQFPSDMGHGRGTGGGYLGLFETGHYLHCLRSLWEDHHFNQSHHAQSFKAEMPDVYELHYEHCVDMLRQRLMCTADANVITYQWVQGIDPPYPNFNTEHQCANFDDLLDYVRQNEVTFPKGYNFTAPPGVVQLSAPP